MLPDSVGKKERGYFKDFSEKKPSHQQTFSNVYKLPSVILQTESKTNQLDSIVYMFENVNMFNVQSI